MMVQAHALARNSIGTDIDPLAVAVSLAKTRSYNIAELKDVSSELLEALDALERPKDEYVRRMHHDLTDAEFAHAREDLWIPEIPRLVHWFRRYVAVDLGRMLAAIEQLTCSIETKNLLLIVFAAIIRNSSNADPVPVSGLEVTSHMLRRDAEGRLINPFALFRRKVKKTIASIEESHALFGSTSGSEPEVKLADATTLDLGRKVDAVITSPPYQNAVDYYRRHQLEMFWLRLTESQADRLALLPRYIGKARISKNNPALSSRWNPSPMAKHWEEEISATSVARARDFRAYISSMARVFERLAHHLPDGAPALLVVGRSAWNGASIPTDALFVELAQGAFTLHEHLTYPVKNRYMSYKRRNGANIDSEHVLVFRRRS
jgi:hypothetical protein